MKVSKIEPPKEYPYCYTYTDKYRVCKHYKHIDGLEGYCMLLKCELLDQVNECGGINLIINKMKKSKKEIRQKNLFDKVQDLRAKYPEMVLTKRQIADLLSQEKGADSKQTIYHRIARIKGI